jgi:ribonuclease Y
MSDVFYLIAGVAVAVIGGVIAAAYVAVKRQEIRKERELLDHDTAQARKEMEARHKEMMVEAKEEAFRIRAEVDRENKEKRADLQRAEKRLSQRESGLDRRADSIERKEDQLEKTHRDIERAQAEVERTLEAQKQELERITGMSREDARTLFLKMVEDESRLEASKLVRQMESEAMRTAERKARNLIALSIQKCAVDQVAEIAVSVVPLPSDEVKGRIIGREGRNIRSFETATGVDLIVDDTPDAVVVSGFDPVRREIARLALTRLISDGRIHPARIEETIKKAKSEVDQAIVDAGDEAIMETGVTGLETELVRLLGRLKYRRSYGQNVLDHSKEVTHLAGVMAAELGVNVALAKRAALLHDIGKAVDFEVEGSHDRIGVELARRYHETEDVCHAIEAHHGIIEPRTVEAVLVQAADALSASRPGARRETLEIYLKRLESLESIADSFPGVEKAYAVQAGREIRVIVKPGDIDDLAAYRLAQDTAKRIEEELEYPGQIKVTVIRETRAVEYAK